MRFLRTSRIQALRESRIGRYLSYAVGEVLLIFIGITLALMFSNLNEERLLRKEEIAALKDIADNLESNLFIFDGNMKKDRSSLADCEKILDLIEDRSPWLAEHSLAMWNCRTWSSPYLHSAAYEALRLGGASLISNPMVRNSIINLFDNVYEKYLGDVDEAQVGYEREIWGPVYVRYMRARNRDTVRPSDYDEFVESGEFRNALERHMYLLDVSLREQEQALMNETRATLDLILSEISGLEE